MSRKNKKRRYTQAQLEKKRIAKKQAKLFALQKNITIFALLIILILGLVSTTFSTSIFQSIENNEGTLVTQVQTSVKQKTELADTKANVDVANTGYDISSGVKIYYLDTDSWGACQMYLWKDSDGYNTYYTLSKIPNTKIYYYNFGSKWEGYSGFKFRSNTTWTKQTNGDIKESVTANRWYSGTSTTGHSTMANINGTAQVTTMISTDGGATWAATANSSIYTTVSGFNVASGATAATSKSANTKTSSSASFSAAYGSSITYQATTTSAATFKGFSTTQYTSGTPSYASTSTTYSRTASANNGSTNTKVYAYYIMNPTATFVNHDGTQLQSGYVTSGTTPVYSGSTPTKTGHTFTGWSPALGNITADTTYTAQFTPSKYTVTLNRNGGTGGTASVTATYGSAMPAITLPTRTGHTFNGYWTSSSGTGSGTQYYTAAGASARAWNRPAATTLYAGWKPNEYTVTLYPNGATINSNNVTMYTYGVGATLPTADDMTLDGYTFYGWYTNSNFIGDPVTSISTTDINDKKYYARWVSNSLTLSVTKVDGSLDASSIVVKENGTAVSANSDGTYSITTGSTVNLTLTRHNSNVYFDAVAMVFDGLQQQFGVHNTDFTADIIDSMETNVTVAYSLSYKPKLTFTGVNDARIDTTSLTYSKDGVTTTVSPANNQSVYVDYDSDVEYKVTLTDNKNAYISDISGLTTTVNTDGTVATGVYERVQGDIAVSPVLTENKKFTLSFIDTPELAEEDFKYYVDSVEYPLGTAVPLPYGAATPVKVIPPQGYYAKIFVDNGLTMLDTAEITYSKGSATFNATVTDTDVVYYVQYVKNPTISVTQPDYGSIYVTSVDENGNTIYYFNGDEVIGGTTLTVHIVPDNSNFAVSSVIPADMTQTANANEWSYQIFDDTVATATISGNSTATDYFATDKATTAQQATASKYDRVVFTYEAVDDDTLSCSVESGNDSIRYSFVGGKLTIIPTSNNNDSVLVKVTSSATNTVKYYLIKLNSFANTNNSEIQKIYDVTSGVGLNLSGEFSAALAQIGFYVSEDNSLFNELRVDNSSFSDNSYNCSFMQTESGVRYYKITAGDAEGNTASVTQKAVFGTDNSAGSSNFYLLNPNSYKISKYNVRVCFEKSDTHERSWASMQPVGTGDYRATIPYGYDKVSIYLTDPDKHLTVKSDGANFNDICYYYVEDQITIDSNSKNVIYEMTGFSKATGITLSLLQ